MKYFFEIRVLSHFGSIHLRSRVIEAIPLQFSCAYICIDLDTPLLLIEFFWGKMTNGLLSFEFLQLGTQIKTFIADGI